MNSDNKKLGYIEGGRFENMERGDERNAVIAELKMPEDFKLSARALVVLEVYEWDIIKVETERLRAEMEKLCAEIDAREFGDAEEAAGIVGECPQCCALRAEIAALKNQQCAAWTESGKCETVEALRAENARLKTLLGRRDPVRCATCGGIRERAEIVCGECGERLEKEAANEAK